MAPAWQWVDSVKNRGLLAADRVEVDESPKSVYLISSLSTWGAPRGQLEGVQAKMQNWRKRCYSFLHDVKFREVLVYQSKYDEKGTTRSLHMSKGSVM